MFNTSFRTLISCLVVVPSTAICALAQSAGISRNLSSTSKSGSHALASLSQSNSVTRRAAESYSAQSSASDTTPMSPRAGTLDLYS